MDNHYDITGFKQENQILRERIHHLEVNRWVIDNITESLRIKLSISILINITQAFIIVTLLIK